MDGTQSNSVVNAALRVKAVLPRIADLTRKINLKTAGLARKCREEWTAVGKDLRIIRDANPSNERFSAVLREYGLTEGLLRRSGTRTDAMWMWDQRANLKTYYKGFNNHPTAVRQDCRDQDFAWAFDQDQIAAHEAAEQSPIQSAVALKASMMADEPSADKPSVHKPGQLTGVWKAVEAALERPLPSGYKNDALRHPKKRHEVEEAYGKAIPKQLQIGSPEAHDIRDVIERLAAAKNPPPPEMPSVDLDSFISQVREQIRTTFFIDSDLAVKMDSIIKHRSKANPVAIEMLVTILRAQASRLAYYIKCLEVAMPTEAEKEANIKPHHPIPMKRLPPPTMERAV